MGIVASVPGLGQLVCGFHVGENLLQTGKATAEFLEKKLLEEWQ